MKHAQRKMKHATYQAMLDLMNKDDTFFPEPKIPKKGIKYIKAGYRAYYIIHQIRRYLFKVTNSDFEKYHHFFDQLDKYITVLQKYDRRYGQGVLEETPIYEATLYPQPDFFDNVVRPINVRKTMSKKQLDGMARNCCLNLYKKITDVVEYYEYKNPTGFHLLKIHKKGQMTQNMNYSFLHFCVQVLRLIPLTPYVGYQVSEQIRSDRYWSKVFPAFNLPLDVEEPPPHNIGINEGTSSTVSQQETMAPCPSHPLLPSHLFKEKKFMYQHDFFEEPPSAIYAERPSRHLRPITNAGNTSIKGYYDPHKDENLPGDFHTLSRTLHNANEEKVATAIKSLYTAWDKARHTPNSASLRKSMKVQAEKLIELLVELKEKQKQGQTGYISQSAFVVSMHFICAKINKRLDPTKPIKNINKIKKLQETT